MGVWEGVQCQLPPVGSQSFSVDCVVAEIVQCGYLSAND
jgi:hypothetical protein